MVILAGLALTGAGLVVYALESQGIEDEVNSALEQEVAEFELRQTEGDPDTGVKYDSAVALMIASLKSNVPSEDEVIFAYWDGEIQRKSPGDEHQSLSTNAEFQRAVTDLSTNGGTRDLETSHGEIRIAVKPVQDPEINGAMVFVFFLDDIRAELTQLMRTYAIVSGLALAALAVGAYVVAGRLLQPVRELRDTAREITQSDLTQRIRASGNDDLTDLTATFNAMLDRLEEAFSAQRQFLDDVGHEMKTPITIVRGHLELMSAGDAHEVEVTRSLVLDEMDRMARLVEELILLAKSRRPGFLHLDETELDRATRSMFDKMRGLGKRDWRLESVSDARVLIDEQRITQAMLQLASNAVRHTDEGDLISMGSRVGPASLELWVRDTGDGIPLDEQHEIFGRFIRGTDAGEGSGLGLAIVRAIAEAHQGEVMVASRVGQGATFTISLPRENATTP